MEANLLNRVCITSSKEFEDFNNEIRQVRAEASFIYFRDEETNSNNNTRDNLFLLLTNTSKITLYVIVILMALIGNLLIIFVISFNKFMRHSTNYFIFNLAICDLAIVFSCVWVQILTSFNEYWVLGEIFCKLNSFFQMISIIASVLTLSLIVCDRYIGIIYPLRTEFKITSRRSYYLIGAVWVISILISLPTYIFRTYTEREWSDFTERHCDDLGWPIHFVRDLQTECILKVTRPLKSIYFTTVILLLFFVPIVIMSIAYTIIIRKLWNTQIIGETNKNIESIIQKRKRVVKMFVIIMATFFICWLPLESMLLYMQYSEKFPSWWVHLEWGCYFMAYSNTAINPLLYAGLSENYKKGLQKLWTRLIKSSAEFELDQSRSLRMKIASATMSSRTNKSKVSIPNNFPISI